MKYLNLRTRKSTFIVLPRKSSRSASDYSFEIDSLKVNLKHGTFTIDPSETDVMQVTALAFVTATLYLLVQPRPKNIAKALMDAKIPRGGKRVTLCNCCTERNNTVEPERQGKPVGCKGTRNVPCTFLFSFAFVVATHKHYSLIHLSVSTSI